MGRNQDKKETIAKRVMQFLRENAEAYFDQEGNIKFKCAKLEFMKDRDFFNNFIPKREKKENEPTKRVAEPTIFDQTK